MLDTITNLPERPDPLAGTLDDAIMTMLQEHVPLSLLIDLTAPEGPRSAEILAEEGEPETAWWL